MKVLTYKINTKLNKFSVIEIDKKLKKYIQVIIKEGMKILLLIGFFIMTFPPVGLFAQTADDWQVEFKKHHDTTIKLNDILEKCRELCEDLFPYLDEIEDKLVAPYKDLAIKMNPELANAQWIFADDIFWKCDEDFDKEESKNAAECLSFIKDYTQAYEKVIADYEWVLVN